ncbi:hypothetical protein EC988_007464 [Linderina pennispora]|nr:hypothetical protein EC988_007464 [Linderina pennispora]
MGSLNPDYYTDKPSPQTEVLSSTTAKEWNIGQFLEISGHVLQSLGKDQFPGYLGKDFKLFGKPALMYREFTQKLVDQLAKNASAAPKTAAVIDGPNGAGKSAELLKLAAVAAETGHIVVYVPATIPWVNSSRPYAPGADDSFVQHETAMGLLRSIQALSSEALAKVPLGKAVTLGKKSLAADKTLSDLVEFGIQTPSLAHAALEQMLEIAGAQKSVPVVIALDEVNTLWSKSAYTDQADKILAANRLRLVRAFLPYFEGTKQLAKGWVVGATSYIETKFMPKQLSQKLNPPPQIAFKNKDVESDPGLYRPETKVPFDVVKLDRMTATEAKAMMDFYRSVRIVQTPVTDALVAKKWVLANGNPRQIFGSCTAFF